MPGWGIALIVIGAIILVIALWLGISYNGLTRSRIGVDEAYSTMDVQLKKRYDLIPNFVNVVKGYAKHEKSTLEEVVKLRNIAVSANGVEEKIKADQQFSSAVSRLLAVVENYPDLKANANFMQLQETLKKVEDEIAYSRKYYNGVVRNYNVKVRTFPTNLVASMFKFTTMPMYEIEDVRQRENVEVQF